ncbi:hypothetical protein [Nostoc cycadae]|uniref:Uncharacterized protein n=1 Tax=Nostoc cycadae WK-1 TaxID=1861711 RepID=A0A2H6LCH8_9NOSO|nr:hypothetical protein [Nostoc cycadae]GBE90836.1 hypothetical protein NCWK1_0556 [Nostoc cycadae WK-1]
MKDSGQEEITVTFTRVDSRVNIISREQFTEDQNKRKIPSYLKYKDLQRYAQTYQRSHRLECYLAHQLRKLGLDAEVLPSKADGNTKAKQADIIISTPNGQKLALEVKEARYKGCTLGLPISDGTDGYSRLPKSLIIDSCSSWDAKVRACERRGEVLLGCVVLAPIGRISDDEFTVLGSVYCPADLSDGWVIEETSNRGRWYEAYVCERKDMRTLSDLVNEVKTW